MDPGNYANTTTTTRNQNKPKPLRESRRMEVELSSRDRRKRAEYRVFLKIRTIVFGTLAVVFLVIGIPLVVVFRDARGCVPWVIGLLASLLGGVCALIFLIYLPIFMRVMASRSETAVYRPRTAEALKDSPYPRQCEVVSSSPPEQPSSRPLTATNPHYNPSTDPLFQMGMPELPPSAPALPPMPTEEPPRYDYIRQDQQRI